MRPNSGPVHVKDYLFMYQDFHLQILQTHLRHINADHVIIQILFFHMVILPYVSSVFTFFQNFRILQIYTKLESHTGYIGVVSASSTRGRLYPFNRRRPGSSLLSHTVLFLKLYLL